MRLKLGRTGAALALTAAAVAVPCGAWYVVGSRETAREARRLRAEPMRIARETAGRMAKQLAARLEALRESESRRPFYHYNIVYHDPKGAYEGASVQPSPLAGGPANPLIRAYFQIDPQGELTLPTLDEQVSDIGPQGAGRTAQQKLLEELKPAAFSCATSIRGNLARGLTKQTVEQTQSKPAQQAASPAPKTEPQASSTSNQGDYLLAQQRQILEPGQWMQIDKARQFYLELKQKKRHKRLLSASGKGQSRRPVVIEVGPFEWRTVMIAGKPALVALREVKTPGGIRVQGIAIDHGVATGSMQSGVLPGEILAGAATEEGEAPLPIRGAEWRVRVDARQAATKSEARAERIEKRFFRLFWGGVAVACLAGLCVVGLVRQSERLARQRAQFAASAAHELRTPLAGLRMYGEMLAEGLGDPAKSGEYARRISAEAERLGRVVTNVLGFTRLERGTLAVRPEPGDLAKVIRECAERLRPSIEGSGAILDLDIPDDLSPVRFDRDAMIQIVQNLLDNAEKYGRGCEDRTVRLSLALAPDGVRLSVSDRGPGISREQCRRLFQPFARGGDPDAPAGLGLGLALTDALARAQGGSISYAAAVGGGSVFTLLLPAG